jgi:hypothetical protein
MNHARALRAVLLLPAALILLLSLAGCLEVVQHPAWRAGAYQGKTDERPETRHFAGDRLSWHAAIVNRNHLQNEYRRLP